MHVAHLPQPLLIALAALVPTCLLLTVVTISLVRHNRHVSAELATVEEGYQGSRYLYDRLNDELAQVRRLNDRLQIVADNRPPSINGQFFGLGGLSLSPSMDSAPLTRRLDDLARATDAARGEVERQEEGFVELTRLLEGRQAQMATLPSIRPARGWIASPFGRRIGPYTHRWKFHEGIDIAGRFGTPVVASADGVVAKVARDRGGYGQFVLVDHGDKVETLYGHLAQIIVEAGDAVQRGDVIAYMGSTGRSTGPHVHYEVRVGGVHRNPVDYMHE